jgi:hypothetical protein
LWTSSAGRRLFARRWDSARRARRSRAATAWLFMRVAVRTGRSPSRTRSARRSVLASALVGERRLRVVLDHQLERLGELAAVNAVGERQGHEDRPDRVP